MLESGGIKLLESRELMVGSDLATVLRVTWARVQSVSLSLSVFNLEDRPTLLYFAGGRKYRACSGCYWSTESSISPTSQMLRIPQPADILEHRPYAKYLLY